MIIRKKISARYLIVVAFSATMLLSCQDVININLKNSAPRIVIEGSISNISDSVFILIHRSTDYFTPSEITSVNDAEVSIVDSAGNTHELVNIMDGVYAAPGFHAKTGDVFNLIVNEGGTEYTANSKMPQFVELESVFIDSNPNHPREDRINLLINDPAGVANYYQVEVFKNDTLLNDGSHFLLYSDKYFDGKSNYFSISGRRLGIERFLPGDSIRVRLINIEKTMYDYLDVLHSITDEMQILSASTPSNPPGNIDNGALGYFAAWSISEKTLIIK